MMIKTEQDIPLSHAATLQTKMKDLSSYNQHKHFEVLRSYTYILILVIHDISVYKSGLLIFFPKLQIYCATVSLQMY